MFISVSKLKTPKGENFSSSQNVFEWMDEEVPEIKDSKLLPFLKKIKLYKKVSHNFQQDIDNQICITPEKIAAIGGLNTNRPATYQDLTETNGKNVTELHELAKSKTDAAINKAASDAATKQIQELQKKINEIKQQKNTTKEVENAGK